MLSDKPSGYQEFQFPPGSRNGLCVLVEPVDRSGWVGEFERDLDYEDHLWGWPDPAKVCVVSGGTAYVVATDSPGRYKELPVYPSVTALHLSTELIALADFQRVHIFNSSCEEVWFSDEIADDGVRLIGGTPERLEGEAWSAARREWLPFVLKLPSLGSP